MQWVARPGLENCKKVLNTLPGSPEEYIQMVLVQLILVSPDSKCPRVLHWGTNGMDGKPCW